MTSFDPPPSPRLLNRPNFLACVIQRNSAWVEPRVGLSVRLPLSGGFTREASLAARVALPHCYHVGDKAAEVEALQANWCPMGLRRVLLS